MNYLIISTEFPPGPGGIGQHAASLALALSKYGTIEVLCNQEYAEQLEIDSYNASLPDNIKINQFKKRGSITTPFLRIFQAIKLAKIQKDAQIIVSGRFPLWIGWLLKKLYPKSRVDGFAHGTEVTSNGGWRAKLTQRACVSLDNIFAVSRFTANQLTGYNISNVKVAPNGVDPNFIKQAKNAFENFNWKGNPKLLTVGNLTPRKGQHRVIKALPTLILNYPDLHYHVVGLPTTLDQLKQLAEDLGVLHAITFHGRLASKLDLMRAYSTSDVFIMLSENQPNGDVEGFGIAILEANSFGKPAIGATGCGIEDAITHNSGKLVNGDSVEEINLALEEIINNYSIYKKGSQIWAEQHNWDEIVKMFIMKPQI